MTLFGPMGPRKAEMPYSIENLPPMFIERGTFSLIYSLESENKRGDT